DDIHDEDLFINWIRVSRVAVLISTCFQVADRGQTADIEGGEEIVEVVLMIRSVFRGADEAHITWAGVVWIRRLHEVLKRFVVRNIVASVDNRVVSGETRVVLAANRAPLVVFASRREAALEPTPSDALGVQQVADVFARHGYLVGRLELWIRG